jgi:hypothetical protein
MVVKLPPIDEHKLPPQLDPPAMIEIPSGQATPEETPKVEVKSLP